MATEFSLESVRQYMLAHEGRVTNHDLVKHYKAWLTHPTEKESARQRFKGRKISKSNFSGLQFFQVPKAEQKQLPNFVLYLVLIYIGPNCFGQVQNVLEQTQNNFLILNFTF